MPDAEPTPPAPESPEAAYRRGWVDGAVVTTRTLAHYIALFAEFVRNDPSFAELLASQAGVALAPTPEQAAMVAQLVHAALTDEAGLGGQIRAGVHVGAAGPDRAASPEAAAARRQTVVDRAGAAWVIDRGAPPR